MREGKTTLLNGVEMAQQASSLAFGLLLMEHWGLIAKWTDTTPGALPFTANPATDELTVTAHGLVAEQIVRVSSTGTLPAGLVAATDYFVIIVDANTIQLALSRADAIAGTQIDITDAGTGTHTETPNVLAVTLTVQYAVKETPEETDWIDSTLNIAIDPAPLIGALSDSNVGYRHMRLNFVTTGGSGLLTADLNAKGIG